MQSQSVLNEILNQSSSSDDELVLEYITRRKYKVFKQRVDHFLWEESDFLARFRLSRELARKLATVLEPVLKKPTNKNFAVSPSHQLLLALQFYASGSFQRCVGDMSGVHKSTVSRIVHRVSCAIANLRSQYIYMPRNSEEVHATANKFYEISSFPRVVGAIDCTHVPLQSPGGDYAENYRNRKDYFSMNVQVVADSNMFIRNVVARWPGASHDSHIFNSSAIKGRFEDGEFNGHWLVGDRGYALKNYMLTPLANPVTRAEKLYNESQIRTRNVVERVFGCWKRRFPAIGTKLRVKIDRVQAIVVATAVLHNMCRLMNEDQPPDIVEIIEEVNTGVEHNPGNASDEQVRLDLINSYFSRIQ